MSAREELNAYLSGLHRRLRIGTLTRGAAAAAAAALAMTVVLVLALEALLFSAASIRGARICLIALLAGIVCVCIALPLRRLTRQRAATAAETRDPRLQQRLLTFSEHDTEDAFVELLAADTLDLTRTANIPALATGTSPG